MQGLLKPSQNLPQILRQSLPALLFQFLRDAVEPLGDGAGDAGKGIAVAAQRNGGADHIFKTLSLQKRGDGFRDGFLTAFHVAVGRTDFVTGAAQVVMEIFLDVPCVGKVLDGQITLRENPTFHIVTPQTGRFGG